MMMSFSHFSVARITFGKILSLVQDSLMLQGKHSERQLKLFSPEVHLLATSKWFHAQGNQGSHRHLRDNLDISK
jgi:hypothetical protein